MKWILLILFWCPVLTAAETSPAGVWHAASVTADDGRWGKYYQSWLTVSEDSIDQFYTLGAHYIKTKYAINKIEGSRYYVYNNSEREHMVLTITNNQDTLIFCLNETACTEYQSATALPEFNEAEPGFPSVTLTSKWCVDEDCMTMTHLPVESEMLFNLYTKPQPHNFAFWGPQELSDRYDIDIGVYSMSFRLSNDMTRLDSFASSLSLMGGGFERGGILAKSGVFVLKDGELVTLTGHDGNHQVTVTFWLHRHFYCSASVSPPDTMIEEHKP